MAVSEMLAAWVKVELLEMSPLEARFSIENEHTSTD